MNEQVKNPNAGVMVPDAATITPRKNLTKRTLTASVRMSATGSQAVPCKSSAACDRPQRISRGNGLQPETTISRRYV